MMVGFEITGWGLCVPDHRITSEELAKRFGVDTDWVVDRCGINERRAVQAGESTATLAIEAGKRALKQASLEPTDIAHLIVSTATPEQPSPATSAFVQHGVGIKGSAHDVNAECAGFVYSVISAAALMQLDPRPILIVGSDTHSLTTDPDDRDLGILVGDGAGALVLEPSDHETLVSWNLGADGSCVDSLKIRAGGSRLPASAETVAQGLHYAEINGNEIYLYAVRHTVRSIKATLKEANLEPADIDHIIPHQANMRIIQSILKHSDIPPDRLISNIDAYGNCASASIPIAMTEALDAGRIKPGDRVLLAGFGAGMAFGSMVLDWGAGK